jgi:hypothetical protein
VNASQDIQFLFSQAATVSEPLEIPLSYRSVVEIPNASGSVIQGVRVFRAGAFKDSLGRATKWSSAQLDQMIQNFNSLASQGIFKNVPVRKNHSKNVDDVVGYIQKLYRDTEQFLVADIEFTDPAGLEKWRNKTFRARSLEVGVYETNDGAKFYPSVLGLAFVDIPAVEGLYSQENEPALFNQFLVVDGNKEINPMDPLAQWIASGKTPESWVAAVNYSAWMQNAEYAQAIASWERDASYAQALADHFAQARALGVDPQPNPVPQPQPDPNQPQPPNQPNPVPPQAMPAFQLATGEMTHDYSRVQNRLLELEQFRIETINGGRAEYVRDLAKAGKLAQTQVESEVTFAQGLSDEQWNHYRITRDAQPTMSLFNQYGETVNESGTGSSSVPAGMMGFQSTGTPGLDVDTAREIVENHKRTGKSAEFIKDSASYKFLAAQNQAPSV